VKLPPSSWRWQSKTDPVARKVNEKGKSKPRSNKYSGSDSTKRPKPGTRDQYWRAGYTRKDGTRVKGHYVKMPD
jgi:hypothetical protein